MAAGGSGAMSGPISKDNAKRLLVSAPMEVVERAPSPFVEGVKDVTFGSVSLAVCYHVNVYGDLAML